MSPPLLLLAALGALLALAVATDGRGAGPAKQAAPVISIEQSCPPPGILACHPALRLTLPAAALLPAVGEAGVVARWQAAGWLLELATRPGSDH